MNAARRWLGNVVLLGISLAFALGMTEFAVRMVAPQPTGLSHQDRFGLAMHWPGITRYLPQYGHSVSLNSAGMRDREHVLAKPAGTFRVLLMGDSFMEALQVPFDSSMAALLARGLEERTGSRVEVINAGVSGWGTDDELRYLTQYGLRYQPDLVVIAMTLHNDLSDNLRQDWHRLDGDSLVDTHRPAIPSLQYGILTVKAWLATRFQTYQLWRRVRHGAEIRQIGSDLNAHVVQLYQEPSPEPIARARKLTGLLLGAVQREAAASGAHTAVVLLPLVHQLTDSTFAKFVEAAGPAGARMRLDRPQRLVTPMADSLGIPVIDLLPAFRGWSAKSSAPLYLGWDGHWNEAGHRLAAGVVVDQLVARGLVRATP